MQQKIYNSTKGFEMRFKEILFRFVLSVCCIALLQAQDIGANLGGGLRITDISYNRPLEMQTQDATAACPYTIDRPPIVGFVPYVAITLTNKRLNKSYSIRAQALFPIHRKILLSASLIRGHQLTYSATKPRNSLA